jgi:hypothetical protein
MIGAFARNVPGLRVWPQDGLTAEARRSGRSLLAQYGEWLCIWTDAARLREIEPHMARDIGVAPGLDRCPEGYAVDPRPLWGSARPPAP